MEPTSWMDQPRGPYDWMEWAPHKCNPKKREELWRQAVANGWEETLPPSACALEADAVIWHRLEDAIDDIHKGMEGFGDAKEQQEALVAQAKAYLKDLDEEKGDDHPAEDYLKKLILKKFSLTCALNAKDTLISLCIYLAVVAVNI